MYSPKIKEDLIPIIYRLGKTQRKPMTKVVDGILRDYLKDIEIIEEETQEIVSIPKKSAQDCQEKYHKRHKPISYEMGKSCSIPKR